MAIQWEQMMAEFHQMGDFDRLRAITKEQMLWLTEVAENVPLKEALDLGFGCGFSSVAMARGGCAVTGVNNEAPNVARRIEAAQRWYDSDDYQAAKRLRERFGLIIFAAECESLAPPCS
jgi:2-polyprenyl-3-methyl-5-hydroxy-6-metoxy-1,4-benzoquinol methylase